jgi:hypothetical protein
MPISQTSYSIGTAVTQIVAPDIMPVRATIHNLEDVTGRKIWIGGANLVQGQSVEINSAVFLQITLDPGDALYACTTSGTYGLGVMIQKQD